MEVTRDGNYVNVWAGSSRQGAFMTLLPAQARRLGEQLQAAACDCTYHKEGQCSSQKSELSGSTSTGTTCR